MGTTLRLHATSYSRHFAPTFGWNVFKRHGRCNQANDRGSLHSGSCLVICGRQNQREIDWEHLSGINKNANWSRTIVFVYEEKLIDDISGPTHCIATISFDAFGAVYKLEFKCELTVRASGKWAEEGKEGVRWRVGENVKRMVRD